MERAVVTRLNSNNSVESCTLKEWVSTHHSEDELRSIFLNMDRALKYIHDHGYCIEVFYPTEINVLNNEDDHIQFKKLMELSKDYDSSRNMIREDIFNSSLIQISTYLNMPIEHLNPEFLKENFDSFAQFLPNDDVPYYRGVIQRGASVYYCEYSIERRKRDLEDLEKQLGEIDAEDKKVIETTPSDAEITNKKVNDVIYRQISGIYEQAAFLNILIIPLVAGIIFMIIMIIALIINYMA